MGTTPSVPRLPQPPFGAAPPAPRAAPPPGLYAEEVADLLARARDLRRPGVAGGLYGLQGLADLRGGAVLVPTVRLRWCRRGVSFAVSDEAFRCRFVAQFPWLEDFDLGAHGLLVAGGAASALLLRPEAGGAFDDVDLFLYGHADDGARLAAINSFAAHLSARAGAGVAVRRTTTSISFRAPPGPTFQVVLRGYSTVAEVLHGFDLGSCAVGFDGRRVWLTELGRVAAERGVNILCLDGRRASYERRLVKYMRRGFDLVLPRLRPGRTALPCLSLFPMREQSAAWPSVVVWRAVPGRPPFRASAPPAGAGGAGGAGDAEAAPEYEDLVATARGCPIEQKNAACLLPARPNLAGVVATSVYDGPDSLGRPAEIAAGCDALLAANCAPVLSFPGALRIFARTPEADFFVESVRERIRALRRQHADGYHFPLVFRGVDAGTLLTAAGSPNSMSEAEWYGYADD